MKSVPAFFALVTATVTIIPSASADPVPNKQLVTAFYTEVLLYGRAEAIDDYIGDTYIQHNPYLPDGKAPLKRVVSEFPDSVGPDSPAGEIVRVLAEDDLVVLHVHHYSYPGPRGGAIVDIFRVADGRIVEHWDVAQAIPEQSNNGNTMF